MRSLIFVCLASLTACSNNDSDASFATASQAQVQRAVGTAGGQDLVLVAVVGLYAIFPPADCPVVSTDAQNVLHIQGGCTASDGTAFSGSVSMTNPPTSSGSDPTKTSHVVFDHWNDGQDSIDGTADLSSTAVAMSLDVALAGIASHDELTMTCDANHLCTYGDSTIDQDGLGRATVSGSLATDHNDLHLTLRGADEVDVASDGTDCIDYSGASSGKICKSTH